MTSRGDEPGSFALASPPPKFIEKMGRGSGKVVPVFEPAAARAPLASGWYTFVLDEKSRFRLVVGTGRRHVEFVRGARVGAAGRFWVDRAGAIAAVDCSSTDYPILVTDQAHRTVHYVIDAFRTSPDFSLAPIARFRFTRPDRSQFRVATDGQLLPERDFKVVDRPRDSASRPDADPPPFDDQSPGGEEGDGLGQRRAL